ncbi:MAG: hypothetical protein ACMUJM_24885 [bacterium]
MLIISENKKITSDNRNQEMEGENMNDRYFPIITIFVHAISDEEACFFITY